MREHRIDQNHLLELIVTMHPIVRQIAASKLLWAAAVLLFLYTLGGFLLAPYLIERYLPRYAERHLGHRATVGAVRVNPFLFTVEASGFELQGSGGGSSMLAFKRLFVDFELSSILRRAWMFGDIRLEGPDLRLQIDNTGRLNLMELIERLRGPESGREGLPRMVFEHLVVIDGRVDLVDLSGDRPASVGFAPVNLELADISTLANSKGHYTFAAHTTGEGSVAWKGNLSLQPLASSGEMSISGMKLSTLWQFLRDGLNVSEPSGELVLAGNYAFSYAQSKLALVVSGLRAEVSGLALARAADAPALLALRSIHITDARFTLANLELVVPMLQLSDGEVRANVSDDGTLDWQRLVTRENYGQPRDVNQLPAPPWRVRMERIEIEKVALTYTDRSTTPGRVVHAQALNGGLMLDVTAGAGAPHVIAKDIQLAATGTVVATPESETPLATLDSFVLKGGGVKIARGRDGPTGLLHSFLSASAKSAAAARDSSGKQAGGAAPWHYRVDAMELKRFGVNLADHSFNPAITYDIDVVSAALTHIDSAGSDPIAFKTELRVGERGTVSGNGTLQQDFGQARAQLDVKGIALEPLRPIVARYARVDLKSGNLTTASGQLDYRYEQGNPALVVSGLRAEVSGLALAPAVDAPALLALRSIHISDARFALADRELVVTKLQLSDGEVRANVSDDGTLDWQRLAPGESGQSRDAIQPPGSQQWHVRVERLGIEKLALTYTDRSAKPELVAHAAALNGGLMLDVTAGAGAQHIIAKDIQLAVSGAVVATPASATPLGTLDSFVLSGGGVDTRARSVLAQSVAMSGGGVKIARGRDGPTGLLHTLLSATSAPATSGLPSAGTATAIASPWQYRVESMELERFEVGLADYSFEPAITYDIDVVSAALTHIDSAGSAPIAFKTELRVGERGTVNSSGTLQQDFGRARAKLDAKGIALEPLRALLARYARADLKSGDLTASAQLDYRPDGKTAFTALGTASVHDFLINEPNTADRLLSWRTLFAEGIALSLAPDRLTVKEVRLLEPGTKIVIAKDRSVNLTQVLKSDASNDSRSSGKRPPFPVEVGRVRLEGGTLDFADLSLILPFATTVQALQGSIVGVSSAPKSRAELRLAGQIDTYGEARAEGALMPWSPNDFLDIEAHFDNVQMPALSPYSATFAGRKVAAGKLWLDLHYKIVNGDLAGENKIVLQDLKLGERVEAPNALDLPLDLAIALLTDSKGKINLAVPVTGDVDNPQFDYGKVIRAAVAGAITRVVTAPFRMLAGLFGKRNAEEFRRVEFAPGSDRISPVQREKLDSLAEALKQRPQLRLVVRGPYDAKRDADELRRELARRDVTRLVGTKLGPEEDPGPIAYGDADTQQALEKLFIERAGADALRGFASQYAKRTGRQPEQVNSLLGGSEDRSFYEAVFDRLVELQPQLDAAPRVLAAKRSQAIIDALLKAGIDRKRLQSGGITEVAGGAGAAIASEFALDVMPGAS